MDISVENLVLVLGGVLTALHAGLLYDFSVDIVPALRSLKGSAHLAMMEAINAKIDADKLSEEADRIRKEFQGSGTPWMRFHTVRTLAAITATTILFVVCLSK